MILKHGAPPVNRAVTVRVLCPNCIFITQPYHLSMVLLNLFEMMDWINCPNSFCCQREETETPPSRCTFRSFRQESRRTAQKAAFCSGVLLSESHGSSNKGLIGGGCIDHMKMIVPYVSSRGCLAHTLIAFVGVHHSG